MVNERLAVGYQTNAQADLALVAEWEAIDGGTWPTYYPSVNEPMNDASDELVALGWDDYGIFKDDPEALLLFDQIERDRDHTLVGGL